MMDWGRAVGGVTDWSWGRGLDSSISRNAKTNGQCSSDARRAFLAMGTVGALKKLMAA
jgi:hypothetical protein